MFTDKQSNNKALYEYVLKTVIVVFALCAALLKTVIIVPEADNSCISNAGFDTAESSDECELAWKYNDTVYNDSETYQAGVPAEYKCGDNKICACRQKISVNRGEVNFINNEIQSPCIFLILIVSAEKCNSALYDITKCYERFLS